MPKTPPKKRTAQIVPKQSTKKHAAIVKKVPATTLITGGTGFLGAHLVRQLVESGQKDLRVMATSIPEWLTGLAVDTIEGSVTNAEDVTRAVDGVTEIYHLAGKVSREKDDAREMYKLHVEGTRLLCEAAKKAGVKTIVLSSSSGTIAVTEKGDLTPDETYPPPLDIIARRINAVPNGGLNFVDVRDTAAAFRVAMQKGRNGERYLLGAVNWTFVKFFDRLQRLTKVASPRQSIEELHE